MSRALSIPSSSKLPSSPARAHFSRCRRGWKTFSWKPMRHRVPPAARFAEVVDRSAAARAASLLRTWSAIVKVLTGLCLLFLAPAAWSQCSPIVVDLNKDGIRLGPAGVGVYFDVDADGG